MAVLSDVERPDMLQNAILSAIRRAVEEEVERAAQAAADAIVTAIRARLAGITASVLSHYSMEMRGAELIIRVQNPEHRP